MNSRRYRQAGGMAMVAVALLASVSCSKTLRESRSSSYLVINKLEAASGAKPDEMAGTLPSDVQTKGSIFQDPGQVTLSVGLKDPGTPTSPSDIAPMNFITVDSFHVSYTRADGRNTQGVDVPYAFDGSATGTVGKSSVTVPFTLVRAQAKMEAPLLALRGLGGAVVISTIAEVTFYGHDQAGNRVSVSGRISVDFADWADPQ